MRRNVRVVRPAPKQLFSTMQLDDAWSLIEAAQRIELMLFCLRGIICGESIAETREIGEREVMLVAQRLSGWLKHAQTRLRKELLGADHPPRWLYEAARTVSLAIDADRFSSEVIWRGDEKARAEAKGFELDGQKNWIRKERQAK